MSLGSWIAVDEVQRSPCLLDEVHRPIDAQRLRFTLTGSIAWKLRRGRGGASLLGGCAHAPVPRIILNVGGHDAGRARHVTRLG